MKKSIGLVLIALLAIVFAVSCNDVTNSLGDYYKKDVANISFFDEGVRGADGTATTGGLSANPVLKSEDYDWYFITKESADSSNVGEAYSSLNRIVTTTTDGGAKILIPETALGEGDDKLQFFLNDVWTFEVYGFKAGTESPVIDNALFKGTDVDVKMIKNTVVTVKIEITEEGAEYLCECQGYVCLDKGLYDTSASDLWNEGDVGRVIVKFVTSNTDETITEYAVFEGYFKNDGKLYATTTDAEYGLGPDVKAKYFKSITKTSDTDDWTAQTAPETSDTDCAEGHLSDTNYGLTANKTTSTDSAKNVYILIQGKESSSTSWTDLVYGAEGQDPEGFAPFGKSVDIFHNVTTPLAFEIKGIGVLKIDEVESLQFIIEMPKGEHKANN